MLPFALSPGELPGPDSGCLTVSCHGLSMFQSNKLSVYACNPSTRDATADGLPKFKANLGDIMSPRPKSLQVYESHYSLNSVSIRQDRSHNNHADNRPHFFLTNAKM